MQRSDVEQHEIPASTRIQFIQRHEHAVCEACEGVAWDLAIRQVRIDAQVVGTDPEGVDGVVSSEGWREIWLSRCVAHGSGVVPEGRNLVLEDGWEVGVDGREDAWGDEVGADGAAHGVVVEVELGHEIIVYFAAGVLDYVSGPGPTSTGCTEALAGC